MITSLVVFAVIGLAVVAAVIMAFVHLARQRQAVEQTRLRAEAFVERQARAVWASATIVGAQGGIITGEHGGVSTWACYELNLEVIPPSNEPYPARTAWLVEVAQMPMLQPGQSLPVKIDQDDPRIIYPNVSWAKYVSG